MAQSEADFLPRTYRVRHTTRYTYDEDVVGCYERGFLSLRPTPTQTLRAIEVTVSPEPDVNAAHWDFFGNESFYVEVRTPYTTFEATMAAEVAVAWAPVDVAALDRFTVAEAVAAIRAEDVDPVLETAYRLPSALVELGPRVAEFADTILAPERAFGEALTDLYGTIYRDFSYRKGATSVRTTLPEILDLKAGVCQDFAHLAIGGLRSVGLPARYVSGYIETVRDPGQPRLVGADASHAWFSTWAPGTGWFDFDPTNDQIPPRQHITTAWGRDYSDVTPLKGVLFGGGEHTLEVAVDVARLELSTTPV